MTDVQHLQALLAHAPPSANPRWGAVPPSVPASICARQTYVERPAAAEDVLQECFLSIWRQAGQYRPDQSQPMTWMTRIVRNRCIDRLRRRVWSCPTDDALTLAFADDSPGPLARLAASRGNRLAGCMGELDGPQRVAIAMAFFDDLAHPTSRRAWTRRWER